MSTDQTAVIKAVTTTPAAARPKVMAPLLVSAVKLEYGRALPLVLHRCKQYTDTSGFQSLSLL
jgi:hypothetical protein